MYHNTRPHSAYSRNSRGAVSKRAAIVSLRAAWREYTNVAQQTHGAANPSPSPLRASLSSRPASLPSSSSSLSCRREQRPRRVLFPCSRRSYIARTAHPYSLYDSLSLYYLSSLPWYSPSAAVRCCSVFRPSTSTASSFSSPFLSLSPAALPILLAGRRFDGLSRNAMPSAPPPRRIHTYLSYTCARARVCTYPTCRAARCRWLLIS